MCVFYHTRLLFRPILCYGQDGLNKLLKSMLKRQRKGRWVALNGCLTVRHVIMQTALLNDSCVRPALRGEPLHTEYTLESIDGNRGANIVFRKCWDPESGGTPPQKKTPEFYHKNPTHMLIDEISIDQVQISIDKMSCEFSGQISPWWHNRKDVKRCEKT